jgi:hypothetical protein
MKLLNKVDIIDPCDECGESTAFGSGKFVNRYPVFNENFDGYRCDECDSKIEVE